MYTRYQLDPNTREYGAGENIIKEEKKREKIRTSFNFNDLVDPKMMLFMSDWRDNWLESR